LQIYIQSQQFLNLYKKTCKDFLQSIATKKFRFECQKAINIPVNAISGVSEQHLRDKYDRLHNLLIGKSSSPNVMQYPQGVIFCKDHLAKKIVVRICGNLFLKVIIKRKNKQVTLFVTLIKFSFK